MAYGRAFAMFSAAMAFTVLATSLRLTQTSLRLLDAMQPSVYGIYLLSLRFHHLAAVRGLRSAVPGGHQIRHRVRRYAFDELGAHRAAAESSEIGADDLRRTFS
jgi:hypothetical protein